LLEVVEESRFIASTDLYQIDGRNLQNLKVLVRDLRRAKHLPIVSSVGRLNLRGTFFPTKTYVYGSGKRGHILHWLHVAHLRALFTKAARELSIPLDWGQAIKHKQAIPDAEITVNSERYVLEVDNSTEGMRLDRIAGKITDQTLIVTFKSEERFQNLAALGGLSTYHGYFHEKEENFNILTESIWWDGTAWRSLL
jgi:hypothetical protein